MQIQKRNNELVDFDKDKISNAILKAMKNGSGMVKENIAKSIADEIENECKDLEEVSIYQVEDMVFNKLISKRQKLTAKAYEGYRVIREYQRQNNTIDNKVIGLIDGTNKTMLDENSNKNQYLISTQRDLVAEEVSKDISLRMKLSTHIAQAHEEGLIHIHDLGHYLNPSFNCCLVNVKDMLDNGTVINGKMIESPKRFQTACTIATQIVAQVASGQFGGQTISIAHLSPYVRKSKVRIEKQIRSRLGYKLTDDEILAEVQARLKEEIGAGIQTFNYQINTLQTSNGRLLPL